MRKIDHATKRASLKPLVIAVALALSTPGVLFAEPWLQVPLTRGADMTRYDSNYVEIGGAYNTTDDFNFGEFSGLYDNGGSVIGNANVRKRLNEDEPYYLNAFGYNLGLPSRQAGAEAGSQGHYWLGLGFDQLTRYQFDDTEFVANGLGSNRLGVMLGSVPAAGLTSAAPNFLNNQVRFFDRYEIKQERDIYRIGGGFYPFGPDWKFSANYRQDVRDGTRLIGASSGGTSAVAILPYELNDKTQQIEALASWTGKHGQLNLSYWYSKYINDENAFIWQNAFATPAGAGLSYNLNSALSGFGRLALPPSNSFNQWQATGGWNFSPWKTRLTGTFAYSMMRQNDSFLPYTINNAAIATPIALPRGSLEGGINNTLVDVSLFTRPLSKLSLKANYQYRNHDNTTDSDVYPYVVTDNGTQPTVANLISSQFVGGSTLANIRRNVPPGMVENKFKFDADYEVYSRTLLRTWYQYQQLNYKERSDELLTSSANNLVGVELRRVMSEMFTGAVRYVYDQRNGSDFSTTRAYRASYSVARTTALGSLVDNATTLRQFFVADYNKNLIGVTAAINPMDRVALGLRGDYYTVDYTGPTCGGSNDQVDSRFAFTDQCLGRTSATGQSYTLDSSYMLAEGWSTFAFYTYQQYATDQLGRQWSAFNANTNRLGAASEARNWTADLTYNDSTFGLGLNFRPEDKKYDVGIQYVLSDGAGTYKLAAATGLQAPMPVPDTRTKMNSLQLYAKYQFSENILFRFNYWYQTLRSNDWSFDNATPTSSTGVLFTGHQSPRYDAHVFGISVAFTNW